MESHRPHPQRPTVLELLALGVFITFAAHAIPDWLFYSIWPKWGEESRTALITAIGRGNSYLLVCLAVALLLAAPTPRRSGLTLGHTRSRTWRLIGIALLPVLLTAIVYPLLPEKPFRNASAGMWLISPAAQDLIFLGYLYGRMAERFGTRIVERVPIDGALVITALFFASWHLVNWGHMSLGFLIFQLSYVFVFTLWTGMTRVLTGSVLWAIGSHMAVNAIAWAVR
jgi:membrane protease YdiL (CAAX protease family)